MTVIISNGATNLSTVNGFYRCEAHALSFGTTLAWKQGLLTRRYIPLTFANGGNFKGAMINFTVDSGYAMPSTDGLTVQLEQLATVTISAPATPAVVTLNSHGLLNTQEIRFTTTGALPTGITAGTTYYVISAGLGANSFEFSTSVNGSAVNTSGTQSGTHTLHIVRSSEYRSPAQLLAGNANTDASIQKSWVYCFEFATPYVVDTTASKWDLTIKQTATSGTNQMSMQCYNSASTLPTYAVWCDNQVSFTSGSDCVIAKDVVTIDMDAYFKGVLGASDATNVSTCAIACKQADSTIPNITAFRWKDMPVSSYTLTLDGALRHSAYSGFRVGTLLTFTGIPAVGATSATLNAVWAYGTATYSVVFGDDQMRYVTLTNGSTSATWSTPLTLQTNYITGATISNTIYAHAGIPTATQAKIYTLSATSGTASNTGFWGTINVNVDDSHALLLFGEVPVKQYATLTADAAASQANIVVDDASGFANGDAVQVGKSDASAAITTLESKTISNIVGTTITLSGNLNTKRLTGGKVIKTSGYGVRLYTDRTTSFLTMGQYLNYLKFSGVEIYNMTFLSPLSGTFVGGFDVATNSSRYLFQDCCFWENADNSNAGIRCLMPPDGVLMNRCNSVGMSLAYSIYNTTGASGGNTRASSAGIFEISNSIIIHKYTNGGGHGDFGGTATSPLNTYAIHDTIYQNGTYEAFYSLLGLNSKYANNTIYGGSVTSDPLGAIAIQQCVNVTETNITIDRASYAYGIGGQFTKNTVINGAKLGINTAQANYDISISKGALMDISFVSILSNPTIALNNLPYTTDGSYLRFLNWNNTTNDDRNYLTYGYINRTGAGLGDTTTRTAGGFSMRFESASSVFPHYWQQNIPTGNIQGKTMTIGIWCYINSATYYATTYQMPRLTINYDNGTIGYAEAVKTIGSWQYLVFSFTPTTTYGQITAKLSTMTDATGSNAYVYFTDWSILYPAGYQLSLGGQGLWANASPVTPTIATNLSPYDVWSVDYTKFGASTVGDKINSIKKDTGLIPALL